MMHLSFTDIFGANATQDTNNITIQKSDFPELTATVDNNGEQVLAVILLKLRNYFEGQIVDENYMPILGIDETNQKQELLYEEFFAFENMVFYLYKKLEPESYDREIFNRRIGLEIYQEYNPNSRLRKYETVWLFNIVFQHCIEFPSFEDYTDDRFRYFGGILSPDKIKPCNLLPQWG
jgi:hypothetical protein